MALARGPRAALVLLGSVGLTLAVAGPARADSGPPCLVTSGHATCTVLRPEPAPARPAAPGAPECIVTVGGLGSDNDDADDDKDTFGVPMAPFAGDPRYQVHRFGSSDEHPDQFPYDTTGAISVNGAKLRDFVRDLSGRCEAIHVMTHSMGGAVADRAFSLGLSAADGVVTYLPISGPHNGAMLARTVRELVDLDEPFAETASLLTQAAHIHDPTSPAVRDLARIRAPRPLRNVVTLRQRLADDAFVYLPDNWDRRVEVRDRLPDAELEQLDGHGGSLKNREIIGTSTRVIRDHELPSDDRSLGYKVLAVVMSVAMAFVAWYVSGKISRVVVEGILLSKAVTVPLRLALPLVTDAIVALLPVLRGGVELARRALGLIADALQAAGDLFAGVARSEFGSATKLIDDAISRLAAS